VPVLRSPGAGADFVRGSVCTQVKAWGGEVHAVVAGGQGRIIFRWDPASKPRIAWDGTRLVVERTTTDGGTAAASFRTTCSVTARRVCCRGSVSSPSDPASNQQSAPAAVAATLEWAHPMWRRAQ